MKLLLSLAIWSLSQIFANGLELTFREEISLRDFYSQGIYPSINMKDGISFVVSPVDLSAGPERKLLRMKRCSGHFTFTRRGELRHGMMNEESPIPVEEATVLFTSLSTRLGIKLRYGTFPPNSEPNPDGTNWTSVAVNYKIPDSDWTFTILGKRSDDLVFLHVFVDKPTTRREDTEFINDWRFAPRLETPEEWSHLPLKGDWRGRDPEVQAFTYLVSSYDEQGKLLPKFAKLREEIESKAALKVSQSKSPPRERRPQEAEAQSPEPVKEVWNKWIGFALLLVVLASVYFLYQRRHRV